MDAVDSVVLLLMVFMWGFAAGALFCLRWSYKEREAWWTAADRYKNALNDLEITLKKKSAITDDMLQSTVAFKEYLDQYKYAIDTTNVYINKITQNGGRSDH